MRNFVGEVMTHLFPPKGVGVKILNTLSLFTKGKEEEIDIFGGIFNPPFQI